MVIIGVMLAKMALVRKVSSISKLPNWWNKMWVQSAYHIKGPSLQSAGNRM